MLKWNEVTKWAKKNNYKVSKKDETFIWTCLTTQKSGEEKSLDNLVKKIYNEITDYKYLEHQKNYTAPSSRG
jgi:hypothetical protein